jgi:hypothetical protein
MANACWTRRLKQAAWVGLFGLAVFAVGAPSTARAQDDEDSIWNLNERLMKNFMGALGLQNGSEDGIDYRERSPLVVPPTRDLPPPEANATAHGPAWPVDPDQKRRHDARTRTRTYLTGTNEDSRPLTPSELNPASVQAARRRGGEVSSGGNEKQMLPSELGYVGGLFSLKGLGFGGSQKDEVATFKQEPARGSLSDPPAGYQTPSPTEPYGVTKRDERKVTPYDPAVGARY